LVYYKKRNKKKFIKMDTKTKNNNINKKEFKKKNLKKLKQKPDLYKKCLDKNKKCIFVRHFLFQNAWPDKKCKPFFVLKSLTKIRSVFLLGFFCQVSIFVSVSICIFVSQIFNKVLTKTKIVSLIFVRSFNESFVSPKQCQ